MHTLDDLARTSVALVARRKPVLVAPDTPVIDVVRRMAAAGRGNAIVVDAAGQPLGIFTQRDLVTRVAPGDTTWRERPVSTLMTREPVTVTEAATFADCLAKMRQHHVRSLPVLAAEHGRPVGVVSIRDLVHHVADTFPEDFQNLPPDPSLEARRPWGG